MGPCLILPPENENCLASKRLWTVVLFFGDARGFFPGTSTCSCNPREPYQKEKYIASNDIIQINDEIPKPSAYLPYKNASGTLFSCLQLGCISCLWLRRIQSNWRSKSTRWRAPAWWLRVVVAYYPTKFPYQRDFYEGKRVWKTTSLTWTSLSSNESFWKTVETASQLRHSQYLLSAVFRGSSPP